MPQKINLQLSQDEAETLLQALGEVLAVFESVAMKDRGPVRDLNRVYERLEDKLNPPAKRTI